MINFHIFNKNIFKQWKFRIVDIWDCRHLGLLKNDTYFRQVFWHWSFWHWPLFDGGRRTFAKSGVRGKIPLSEIVRPLGGKIPLRGEIVRPLRGKISLRGEIMWPKNWLGFIWLERLPFIENGHFRDLTRK